MAVSASGNKGGKSGSSTRASSAGTRRKSTASSQSGTGKAGADGGTKARRGGKTTTVGKKPAATGKKPARKTGRGRAKGAKGGKGGSGTRVLAGLILGLVIGGLVTVLLLYEPRTPRGSGPAMASSEKQAAPARKPAPPAPARKPVIPAPPVRKAAATPAPVKAAPAVLPAVTTKPAGRRYEEHLHLEIVVRRVDRAFFLALEDLSVPENGVRFAAVTTKTKGEDYWDHALIDVHLPGGCPLEKALDGLRQRLTQADVDPDLRLGLATGSGANQTEIRVGPFQTHTIRWYGVSEATPPREPSPDRGHRPKVAIIIDDFGLEREPARCLLELPSPVAFSILPFLPHSKDVAVMAHEHGFPVMVHLPMEPLGYPGVDPGPGALTMGMSRERVQAGVRAALENIPYAVGVNNHLGSRFTSDAQRMSWVMEEVKRRGLFFVDSMTIGRSMGYSVAQRMGVPAGRRSLFLDHDQDPAAVRIQLRRLVAQARQDGSAVAIGHIHPTTCQVLREEYNETISGVDLVPVSTLIKP